jgi:hypothetical protein
MRRKHHFRNHRSKTLSMKPLKPVQQSFAETLAALTIECSNNQNAYIFLYAELGEGYKGVIEWVIEQARLFEKFHAKNNWEKDDWYDAIDEWIKAALHKLGYDENEEYTY